MNQVSRPMQIALAAVLVFAALWFVALKPKDDAAEPVAAGPVTPATATATPRPVDAGGAAATSTMGKVVESANNAANTANTATKQREQQTGEEPASPAPAADAPATTPAGSAPATKSSAATKAKSAAAKKPGSTRSASQRRADRLTETVGKHLAKRRAVVVVVSSPTGSEDRIIRKRVRNEINRRGGRVKVYFISATKIGLYEGLLGSLNLSQTPSTVVIAPNNEAKVLGGLVSTARLDRLTSAALLLKPAAAAK